VGFAEILLNNALGEGIAQGFTLLFQRDDSRGVNGFGMHALKAVLIHREIRPTPAGAAIKLLQHMKIVTAEGAPAAEGDPSTAGAATND
jgi:hypothetical protein